MRASERPFRIAWGFACKAWPTIRLDVYRMAPQSPARELLTGITKQSQDDQDVSIVHPRVGLASDSVELTEFSLFGHQFIDSVDFRMILFEQFKERCLTSGSAFATEKLHIISGPLYQGGSLQQISDPQSSSFSNCNRLRRLKVRLA